MADEMKKLHEDLIEKEIAHEEKVIKEEHARIREHQAQEADEKNGLMKDLHNAEIKEEEDRIIRESHRLDAHEAKIDSLKTGDPDVQEACDKAEEFKKLADQVEDQKIINEDLFETPIQPLK